MVRFVLRLSCLPRSFRPSFPSFDGSLVPCLSWSAIDPSVPCPKPNQVTVFFFRG
jgi:hypothetical protein